MSDDPDIDAVAGTIYTSVGLLIRRLKQSKVDGELTLPEASALALLDRGGESTSSALARREQISPQSMGVTLNALEERGLIHRHADPSDGRRVLLSISAAGQQVLRSRRDARSEQIAQALSDSFSRRELRQLAQAAPLIERLAQNL